MAWAGRSVSHADFDWEGARCVGQGAIAKVYLATYRPDGATYAVKAVSKLALIQLSKVDAAFNEKALLKEHVATPRVATLYATFQTEEEVYYVLQYLPRGHVEMMVLRYGALPRRVVAHLCACVVAALDALHRSGWVVRDVKAENCCIDDAGYACIVDFDTALRCDAAPRPLRERTRSCREIPEEELNRPRSVAEIQAMRRRTQMFAGTAQYISPEMLDSCDWSHASDLWALGCVCYLAATGRPAFDGVSQFDVFRRVVHGQLVWPEGMDAECADFCRRLLVNDPCARLGASPGPKEEGYLAAVREHPLFAGIDWARYREPAPPPFDFGDGPSPEEDPGYLTRMLEGGESWDPWKEWRQSAPPPPPLPEPAPAAPAAAPAAVHADPSAGAGDGGDGAPADRELPPSVDGEIPLLPFEPFVFPPPPSPPSAPVDGGGG